MSFNEYRTSRLGRYLDIDGFYWAQCWDEYADYCTYLGVPYANCTVTGYARDVWEQRATNGMLKNFDEVNRDNCKKGDIIVFKPQGETPLSHIGTVAQKPVNGKVLVLGQNQGGSGAVNEVWLPLSDSYPTVFRLKTKQKTQYDGNCKPVNDLGLKYCAHTQDIGWREWVHDGMIAGSTGAGKRLEAIKIDTSDFGDKLKLEVKVHIQDKGWIRFKNVEPTTTIGTVGYRLRIEAIEIDTVINETGKQMYYQVHLANTGWTGKVPAGFTTGTIGIKKAIEAIKIWLE